MKRKLPKNKSESSKNYLRRNNGGWLPSYMRRTEREKNLKEKTKTPLIIFVGYRVKIKFQNIYNLG